MRVAIFLVCLFSLLASGDDNFYSTTLHRSFYGQVQHIDNLKQIKPKISLRKPSVFKNVTVETEKDYFISDNIEDEDSNFFAKKYKWPARDYFNFCYQSLLVYLRNCLKAPPSDCPPISYRYITQRVLRI